jgi:hypothetical protein
LHCTGDGFGVALCVGFGFGVGVWVGFGVCVGFVGFTVGTAVTLARELLVIGAAAMAVSARLASTAGSALLLPPMAASSSDLSWHEG